MMKNLLILALVFIHGIVLGQTNKGTERTCSKASKTDTIPELLVIHSEMRGQTSKDVERGFYKVLKIDTLSSFYLIFVERDKARSTIYSEKSINVKGQEIKIDSTYYFELSCKDTLYNGVCLIPVANVTYFGKYLGDELGKLSKAKNLYGLTIVGSSKSTEPDLNKK